MSRGVDLSAIDAVKETETITFDFGKVLAVTSTIISAVVTCESTMSVDSNPASRLVGLIGIIASPANGAPAGAVMQKVGNMVAGETYRLSCQATLSDSQVLNLWTHLPCVAAS